MRYIVNDIPALLRPGRGSATIAALDAGIERLDEGCVIKLAGDSG